MNAQELKHKARLAEWKEKVALCRSSGMSVRGWCQEQGIAHKTYYYWEEEVLSEAGRQAVALNGVENRFVEVPALPESISVSERKPVLVAKLRIKSGELEIYAGAEAGSFQWPRNGTEVKQITAQQYRWLMEGLSVEQPGANRPVTGLRLA